MKISVLTDNRTKKRGFLAEHGLSVYIEDEEVNILFDTGQSDVYCHNAFKMGLDLSKTDYIVLSHGHYDHCGGLVYFPKKNRFPSIYVHQDAFFKKYKLNRDGKGLNEIGIPWSAEKAQDLKNSLIFTGAKTALTPSITLLAEIPGTLDFEGTPSGFYVKNKDEMMPDILKDEQMLIFDTEKGLSVFLGCSHVGIINCLNYALAQFPGKKIDSLVAGMHLDKTEPFRLKLTIQHMLDLDIKKIIPLHCTGIFAIVEMKRLLGKKCFPLCAGDFLEI